MAATKIDQKLSCHYFLLFFPFDGVTRTTQLLPHKLYYFTFSALFESSENNHGRANQRGVTKKEDKQGRRNGQKKVCLLCFGCCFLLRELICFNVIISTAQVNMYQYNPLYN